MYAAGLEYRTGGNMYPLVDGVVGAQAEQFLAQEFKLLMLRMQTAQIGSLVRSCSKAFENLIGVGQHRAAVDHARQCSRIETSAHGEAGIFQKVEAELFFCGNALVAGQSMCGIGDRRQVKLVRLKAVIIGTANFHNGFAGGVCQTVFRGPERGVFAFVVKGADCRIFELLTFAQLPFGAIELMADRQSDGMFAIQQLFRCRGFNGTGRGKRRE